MGTLREGLTCETVGRAALGQPANKRGAELLYRCPRHDDQHPSLQINVAKNAWLCGPCGVSGNAWQLAAFLAGCDPANKGAVQVWLVQHGLLKRGPGIKNSLQSHKAEIATYSYTDVDGRLLYQKVRYEPKDFAIRRPDGTGGWLWGLGGVTPVLYNLPEVVKSREVLYVEGEKDAETAKKLRLVATTRGGVGSWRKEFAQHFAGRRVSILVDADEPGRRHARQVAVDLVGITEIVKLLELPGAKDLTEWVRNGGTREALVEILNAAPALRDEDVGEAAMTTGGENVFTKSKSSEHLGAELAQRVMGWGVAPDRFLTGDRSWMPRWRFQPTKKLEDAFRVLEMARPEFYNMRAKRRGTISVEVRIGGKVGKSRGDSKPLAITLAVARALGLEE